MEIPEPIKGEFTVYSKSGCPNCLKVKTLLKNKNVKFTVVDCDEFILENKEQFLQIMYTHIGKEYNMFPMVFDGKTFIGGLSETNKYIELLLAFDLTF